MLSGCSNIMQQDWYLQVFVFFDYNIRIDQIRFKIRQSKNLENPLIKIGRPIPKPIYNVHNLVGVKLLTRLRLGLSHLSKHKFNHNFQNCVNPLCLCSLEVSFPFPSALPLLPKDAFNPLKWITVHWYELVKSGRWYSSRNTSSWQYKI